MQVLVGEGMFGSSPSLCMFHATQSKIRVLVAVLMHRICAGAHDVAYLGSREERQFGLFLFEERPPKWSSYRFLGLMRCNIDTFKLLKS